MGCYTKKKKDLCTSMELSLAETTLLVVVKTISWMRMVQRETTEVQLGFGTDGS